MSTKSEIVLPEYGYTPNNFNELIRISGMSNARFMKQFDINYSSFYKYTKGERSMSYLTWERIYKEAINHLKNQSATKVAFSSKSVDDVVFVIEDIDTKGGDKTEAEVSISVIHDDKESKVDARVSWDGGSKGYELFIGDNRGVDAVKKIILSTLSTQPKKANTAEFLLDVDRHSAGIHNSILKEAEVAINTQRRKR